MSEEYEIIFITEEGRAIKNNKTGKIYHSVFEIIEEKNKENEKLKYLADDSNTMKAFIVEHNKVEQLENIINEAIEFMKENCDIITIDKGWIIRSELTTTGLGKLFKILNKGE